MKERRGSIRQRGTNTWRLRVYRGVNPDTGRQRYATRTVHGSRRVALEALEGLVAEVDNATTHEGSLAELLERWSAASAEWEPSTQATVRWATRCHLVPHLGHLPVAKLTAADIDDFYAFLLRSGGSEGCGLDVDTVRRIHGVLHQAMVQALLWDWIWINPAAGASPPRTRKSEIRPPEPAWVADLLDWTESNKPMLFVLLRMAATTGARRSQLMALRWRDIDLDRGTVAFTRALVIGSNGPVLTATKTNRTYQVDLDRGTWKVLGDRRQVVGERAREAGTMLPGVAFVFTGKPDGHKPYTPGWATDSFNAARRACGLPHFRLHDLRHFMATQMLAAGVPIATVSARLNHARISTTVNVYTHAIRAWDRPAAETLSDIIATGERGRAGARHATPAGTGEHPPVTDVGYSDASVAYPVGMAFERITTDPARMRGLPCIRGTRITVSAILGQLAAGRSIDEVLADYPQLEREDVLATLEYAAAYTNEREIALPAPG